MSTLSEQKESESLNSTLHKAANSLIYASQQSILLVEDTAAHAAIIRRVFSDTAWELEHVTRAEDAIRSYEKNSHRIVLLDLTLPDMSGIELLTKLKTINPSSVVIIITSRDEVKTSVEAMQKGARDYVVKSDPQELSTKILAATTKAWNSRITEAENYLIEQTKIVELVKSQRLKAIETLVRTVCHEVNNPLSGVVALSQLLSQKDGVDDDVSRLADEILKSANQVAEVVKKLKNVGDDVIEFGGQEIIAIDSSSTTE